MIQSTDIFLIKNTDGYCHNQNGWFAVFRHIIYKETCSTKGTLQLVSCKHSLVKDEIEIFDLNDLNRKHEWDWDFSSSSRVKIARTKGPYSIYSLPYPQTETGPLGIYFCGCGSGEISCESCCIDCCGVARQIIKKFE